MYSVSKIVSTKRLAVIAMLVAQAAVLHYLESLIPNPVPVPGVKLGLANIITLIALVIFDFRTALEIAIMRTILGSLLAGTLFGMGFFMSFSGAVTSTVVMALILRSFNMLSMVGISILGAIAHNVGQLIMATLVLHFPGIFFYLPAMLLFSIPTGILTGLLTNELVKYIRATNRVQTLLDD
ncbi:MAG TPA: Gx transporter family protein [Syntrophomonadaceae bacterium]|jgi:heptaprenyl diphosphate synthase|nr:Gx transporter family protein [Syntrophomonadaceae bacterium]HOQ10671.1 Gx transporter family protein [Syntrophomonadaceae bacterium]HPU49841.1 Gx transporter family protein [Syntrophomonadaceae bacterium]